MGAKQYILSTKINGHPFKKVWDSSEPVTLGYPAIWKLEKTDIGVSVTRLLDAGIPAPTDNPDRIYKAVNVAPEYMKAGCHLRLCPKTEKDVDDFSISIRPTTPITPVFRLRKPGSGTRTIQLDAATETQKELFVFTCFGSWVVESEPIHAGYVRKGFTGYFSGRPAFNIREKKGKYVIYAQIPLKIQQGFQVFSLDKGKHIALSPEQLLNIKLHIESCHWRFANLPSVSVDSMGSSQDTDPQTVLYRKIVGLVLGLFSLGVVALQFMPEPKVVERLEHDVKLDFEQPKIIVKAPDLPKEEKKPEPKKPEPKKPEVKKAEAPHPERKPEPKRAPEPPKPQPKPIAQAPKPVPQPPRAQPQPVQPKPQPVVQAPPKPVAPPPDPQAVQRAQAQQMLAKSLGFLSGAKSNISVKTPAYTNQPTANYDAMAKTSPQAINNTALTQMSKNAQNAAGAASGPIDTRAARNIATDKYVPGMAGGKSLNQVQGKVALGGGHGNFSGSFGGVGETTTSGQGQLSSDAINATLRKYEDKLRFCYEKALLTNPNLGGTVKIEWTISSSGSVSAAHVVNSQINSSQMHSCLTGVISGVKFPSPKGGSVIVNKTFAFTASAL